jgi:hypothetical protein
MQKYNFEEVKAALEADGDHLSEEELRQIADVCENPDADDNGELSVDSLDAVSGGARNRFRAYCGTVIEGNDFTFVIKLAAHNRFCPVCRARRAQLGM